MKKLNGAIYLVRRLRERGNPLPPWWKLRGIVDRPDVDLRPDRPGELIRESVPISPS